MDGKIMDNCLSRLVNEIDEMKWTDEKNVRNPVCSVGVPISIFLMTLNFGADSLLKRLIMEIS